MITSFDVYLICVLPKIAGILFAMGGMGSAVSIFFWIICFVCGNDKDENEKDRKIYKRQGKMCVLSLCGFIFLITAAELVPDKKEIAAIYLIPKIVNNQDISQVPTNIAKLLNMESSKYIKSILNIKEDHYVSTIKKNR